MAAITLERVTG